MSQQNSENKVSLLESVLGETWRIFRDAASSNTVGTTIDDWNAYFEGNKEAYDLFYAHFQSKSFALISALTGELALKTYFSVFGQDIEKTKAALDELDKKKHTQLIDALVYRENINSNIDVFQKVINHYEQNNLPVDPDIQ